MWIVTVVNVCLLVIYNYDGHSEYDLQLAVGDTVQIREQFPGNYILSVWTFSRKKMKVFDMVASELIDIFKNNWKQLQLVSAAKLSSSAWQHIFNFVHFVLNYYVILMFFWINSEVETITNKL